MKLYVIFNNGDIQEYASEEELVRALNMYVEPLEGIAKIICGDEFKAITREQIKVTGFEKVIAT